MGVDHVIDLACDAKRALGGTEGIVNMIKARSRAEAVIRVSRERGDQRPPSAITFEVAFSVRRDPSVRP